MNESVSIVPASPKLAGEIINNLRSLPYPAFLKVVASVLETMGYSDVKALRQASDRNVDGGIDFTASVPAGLVTVAVVAQAKQYSESVQKRYVDEIRGAAVRESAQHAVIVSTSPFAPSARAAAAKGTAVPVRLVDGEEVAALMSWHRIGVVRTKAGLQLDLKYFEDLAKRYEIADNRVDSHEGGEDNPSLTFNVWFGERTSSSVYHRSGS